MKKYLCRCGLSVDELRSYFNKNGSRVTVCEICANRYGLTNEKEFISIKFDPKDKNGNNK